MQHSNWKSLHFHLVHRFSQQPPEDKGEGCGIQEGNGTMQSFASRFWGLLKEAPESTKMILTLLLVSAKPWSARKVRVTLLPRTITCLPPHSLSFLFLSFNIILLKQLTKLTDFSLAALDCIFCCLMALSTRLLRVMLKQPHNGGYCNNNNKCYTFTVY